MGHKVRQSKLVPLLSVSWSSGKSVRPMPATGARAQSSRMTSTALLQSPRCSCCLVDVVLI
jgi:hypothetical protein